LEDERLATKELVADTKVEVTPDIDDLQDAMIGSTKELIAAEIERVKEEKKKEDPHGEGKRTVDEIQMLRKKVETLDVEYMLAVKGLVADTKAEVTRDIDNLQDAMIANTKELIDSKVLIIQKEIRKMQDNFICKETMDRLDLNELRAGLDQPGVMRSGRLKREKQHHTREKSSRRGLWKVYFPQGKGTERDLCATVAALLNKYRNRVKIVNDSRSSRRN